MSDLLHHPVSGCDFMVRAMSFDPDRLVAIGQDGERLTAGELAAQISQMQQLFESLEPRPRRAAVLSRNRLEILAVNSGLDFADIVGTALHPMGALEDYLYVMEDAGIDLLIYDPAYYEDTAAALIARAPGIRHAFAMGGQGAGRNLIEAAARFVPGPLVAPLRDPDHVSRIAYSGGTTGKPKGILCTNGASATSFLTQMMCWEWPREIRHLICAPLSHAGGAMLMPILHRGGHMVVIPGFEPVAVMQAIQDHRITSILLVPTMVLTLIDHPRFAEFDLSSLEICYYGASSFPPARLKDAIDRLGPIFFQFYGQAEAPMSITVLRRDEHDTSDPLRMASCGRPTPMVRVALLDDAGQPVPDGTPGEICVRGSLVNGGYLNKPEETAAAFAGDWLHTGDVAIRNPDGFLRIVDRKKDMIVTGGFNVFAREVEDVLTEHPGVRQAAVIGVPDPRWGEAVKAVVVLEPGVTVDPATLIARVRERKGAVQAPKTVDFVDALPVTAIGKPDKKTLRARYAAVAA
ncbi:AMP-binding protein [Novosphingobium bradum]|uniref:AMP-binding protein n=1 Tax=Novosphingobium bradum TaxID=1737444 RepID=A0ABV7IT23_9SPHN